MKIMLWVERAMDVALRVLWHRRAFIWIKTMLQRKDCTLLLHT
jgi:hypothetical protein